MNTKAPGAVKVTCGPESQHQTLYPQHEVVERTLSLLSLIAAYPLHAGDARCAEVVDV